MTGGVWGGCADAAEAPPVSLHPDNPKYFQFRGKPLVLITATDAILKRSIFSAARIATLNGHPGWLPGYRGLGATWYQMERGLPPAEYWNPSGTPGPSDTQ